MKLFLRICAVVMISALASLAGAQTRVDSAAQWGLLGTWMTDCRQRPTLMNSQDTYVARGGQLYLDRDLGPQYGRDSTPITSVSWLPDGTIELTEYYANVSPPQSRRTIIVKGSDGRIRVLVNLNLNTGAYSVRNGLLTDSGMPTPWQGRCR